LNNFHSVPLARRGGRWYARSMTKFRIEPIHVGSATNWAIIAVYENGKRDWLTQRKTQQEAQAVVDRLAAIEAAEEPLH
jgi:hypothetical protein